MSLVCVCMCCECLCYRGPTELSGSGRKTGTFHCFSFIYLPEIFPNTEVRLQPSALQQLPQKTHDKNRQYFNTRLSLILLNTMVVQKIVTLSTLWFQRVNKTFMKNSWVIHVPLCSFGQGSRSTHLSSMFLLTPLCAIATRMTTLFLAGEWGDNKRKEKVRACCPIRIQDKEEKRSWKVTWWTTAESFRFSEREHDTVTR